MEFSDLMVQLFLEQLFDERRKYSNLHPVI
jgi:hypothetical protein